MTTDGSAFEKDGSVVAWLREKDVNIRLEILAIKHLTTAPLDIRARFILELAEEYRTTSEHAETRANPRSVIVQNLGYLAGTIGDITDMHETLLAWREVDPTIEHPYFPSL